MEMVELGQNQHSSAPKRIKMMEEEDRMSALPDCLLVEIVSRLPSIKEAIRTGTISKRWQHIWPYVTTLIFINHGVDYPLDKNFFSFVDKTLAQCRHLNLHKFQLHSTYYVEFELQVNNFIRYAIDCHVRELDLELTGLNFEAEFLLDEYIFINPCFTDLKLGGCIINPSVEISWNALRSLCIVGGKLDEDMIQKILSGSPLLETLNLQYCYGYRRIYITSKTVKNLLFSGYYDADETAIVIEINASYIWSLTIQYELFMWNLLLRNVPSLVEANLDYTKEGQYDWYDETTPEHEEEEMLKRFISNLHHVKKLTIGSDCSTVFSRLKAKGFISPSNIKVVDVTSHLYSNGEALELNDLSERESRVEINCLTVVLEVMRLIGCWH